MALYDRIGISYDATRRADPYLLGRILKHLQAKRSGLCLDVGCGTGNYTIAMRRAGVPIIGVDAAMTMLARAREKSPTLPWCQAHAEELPFRSRGFHGATCIFVHHHMDDPIHAFREVRRVLDADARFVLFNTTAEQMRSCWLIEYFPKLIERATEPYIRLETTDALRSAGFQIECVESYEIAPDLQDQFLYCGKYRPELYLDPRVRAGISGFANAPDPSEVEGGLARLGADIASNRIADVIRAYAHDRGDYTFTVAVK